MISTINTGEKFRSGSSLLISHPEAPVPLNESTSFLRHPNPSQGKESNDIAKLFVQYIPRFSFVYPTLFVPSQSSQVLFLIRQPDQDAKPAVPNSCSKSLYTVIPFSGILLSLHKLFPSSSRRLFTPFTLANALVCTSLPSPGMLPSPSPIPQPTPLPIPIRRLRC